MEESWPLSYPSYTERVKCRHCGSMLGGLKLVDGDKFEHADPAKCFAQAQLKRWEKQYIRRLGMESKVK